VFISDEYERVGGYGHISFKKVVVVTFHYFRTAGMLGSAFLLN
jgi:hypothetical protein